MKQIPDVPAETGLYPIIDIDGHQPHDLTDFIGSFTISIAVAGEPRRLVGIGDLTDRGVQFQQHAADINGTDVGVWAIAEDGDGTFWAEPLAARVTPKRQ
jgi:hypothetical protein